MGNIHIFPVQLVFEGRLLLRDVLDLSYVQKRVLNQRSRKEMTMMVSKASFKIQSLFYYPMLRKTERQQTPQNKSHLRAFPGVGWTNNAFLRTERERRSARPSSSTARTFFFGFQHLKRINKNKRYDGQLWAWCCFCTFFCAPVTALYWKLFHWLFRYWLKITDK